MIIIKKFIYLILFVILLIIGFMCDIMIFFTNNKK